MELYLRTPTNLTRQRKKREKEKKCITRVLVPTNKKTNSHNMKTTTRERISYPGRKVQNENHRHSITVHKHKNNKNQKYQEGNYLERFDFQNIFSQPIESYFF
jgi:hypothetical protein